MNKISMDRSIVKSEDGSHTVYAPEVSQHYHSLHGALTESCHVFIQECLLHSNLQKAVIFEAGFGTGLNALLTLKQVVEKSLDITYYSIDKYPLSRNEWTKLNHGDILPENMKKYFETIHETPWGSMQVIHSGFKLFKIHGDLMTFIPDFNPDLVYFDAFSPDAQPELWTGDVFGSIYSVMKTGGILTTYSAKGSVRRTLKECGYKVEKIQGPPGKREMIRAVK